MKKKSIGNITCYEYGQSVIRMWSEEAGRK